MPRKNQQSAESAAAPPTPQLISISDQEARDKLDWALFLRRTGSDPEMAIRQIQELADGVLGWAVETILPSVDDATFRRMSAKEKRRRFAIYVSLPVQMPGGTKALEEGLAALNFGEITPLMQRGASVAKGPAMQVRQTQLAILAWEMYQIGQGRKRSDVRRIMEAQLQIDGRNFLSWHTFLIRDQDEATVQRLLDDAHDAGAVKSQFPEPPHRAPGSAVTAADILVARRIAELEAHPIADLAARYKALGRNDKQ